MLAVNKLFGRSNNYNNLIYVILTGLIPNLIEHFFKASLTSEWCQVDNLW